MNKKRILTVEEKDSLQALELKLDFQKAAHTEGLAPYFREVLRKNLKDKFKEKNEDGSLKYAKQDGTKYDIYKDGLKVYTTIDSKMQKYAERAVVKHLRTDLQNEFYKVNKRSKNKPFSNNMNDEQIDLVMSRAIKISDRYRSQKADGMSDKKNLASFQEPVSMQIFSWEGDIDTVMTPYDSIKYHKGIIQASLMSMDPTTGFVKAWVGGPDFERFSYDHVTSTRQVGSTIKPFVYAAALNSAYELSARKLSDSRHFDMSRSLTLRSAPTAVFCSSNFFNRGSAMRLPRPCEAAEPMAASTSRPRDSFLVKLSPSHAWPRCSSSLA